MNAAVLSTGCLPYVEGYMPSQNKNLSNPPEVWDFCAEADLFFDLMNLPGQHKETGFGRAITEVMARKDGPKKWIEVGTWNGKGTTLCLLQGLRQREEKDGVEILSYEADPFLYSVAIANLQNHPYFDYFLRLVHGRIPSTGPFPVESEIPESEKGEGSHFFLNYEREKAIFQAAPQIAPPFVADAVILDGGEYTGRFDWEGLEKSLLSYVFLDDVGIYKHKPIYETLLKSPEWKLYREDKEELNGWAVFQRV
jgi:hypothetical protein